MQLRRRRKNVAVMMNMREFYGETPVNSLLYSIVMETEEDNVLYQTPAKALAFIDRLERKRR